MPKLTEKEREGFEIIIQQDMVAIQQKVVEQIKFIWDKARDILIKKKGHDKLMTRKEEINEQIEKLQEEKHKIENELNSETLTKQQIVELGGTINDFGRAEQANFFHIPVTSQFEYEIVQYIKEHIDLEVPAKFLYDLGRSCERELTMVGTFEEAKKVYEKLYALDFRKYGVDIPPRLSEIKKHELIANTKEVLQLEEKSKTKL